jgi:alpha-galactosidase
MARIAFIGAGSIGFTRGLVRDILTFPLLKDATLVLMDINKERLEFARKSCQTIINRGRYPAKIETTMNRITALKKADAVICTILAGGVNIWRHDIEIPKKYGVDANIGDTRGVSGIFRALRTIPVMVSICKDMEKHCPDAILLNYTNPMAMLCRAMQKTSAIKVTGLCHSVQGTAGMLASWLGRKPMNEITYVCAGINHQAWYIDFRWKGKDMIPRLKKIVAADKNIYKVERVRNEMFLNLGYYVTESSGHNSEYSWWFRKRPDLIKKYCSTESYSYWNPGAYAYILKEYLRRDRNWKTDVKKMVKATETMPLDRGHEYASSIISAYLGGEPLEFNANVPNTAITTNLPNDVCVEIPVVANKRGFNSIHVGALPPQCAALNNISVATEEMAVEAALTGDPEMVYHAVAYAPLTAAVLSLAEIRKMVREMLKKNKPYLPQFRSVNI